MNDPSKRRLTKVISLLGGVPPHRTVDSTAKWWVKSHPTKKFVLNAEGDFFRVLRVVVGNRGHVLAQVSLRQLLWFPPKQAGLQAWRNRVAQKSIVFVVCDVATLRPLVAIELDEPSHAQPDRQARDEAVHAMLTAAGLPWVCVLTSRTYDTRELESALAAYLPAGGE